MAEHTTLQLFLTFTLFSAIAYCQSDSITQLWVVLDDVNQTYTIYNTSQPNFIAVASFDNSINQTGWAKLDVITTSGPNQKYTDFQQMYAAGFVEGHITRSLIGMHWINTVAGFCQEPLSHQCLQLKKFLEANLNWMKEQISAYGTREYFWHHINLYLLQATGLQDGYSNYPGVLNTDIDVLGLYFFQVGGDMEDLGELFPSLSKVRSSVGQDNHWGFGRGHCSALLRLLPDFSDLYVAQDTWNDLPSMLRILKRYNFDLHLLPSSKDSIPGNIMTFSSYPGVLSSGDDFYLISSGLLSQETTIGNSNPDLLKYITYTSVLESFRSMVANRLASSGKEWAFYFSQFNSGTYNNQWMIVDYNKFVPFEKKPTDGLFYLLEQIPGTIYYEDLSQLLYNQSYFGSYNVAYFPNIFNASGMPALVNQFGDWFTYDKNPRALIYKRDVPKVVDMNSMTRLMRYNDFIHDPLSSCNCTPPYSAENAIACRDDLNPIDGTYPFSALGHRPHIATDMKLANFSLSLSLSFLAISSPTYDDLPPFQWSKSDYNTMSHVGHPDLWMFPLILFNGTYPMA
ncbi:phospholipase B-like 2 [Biomphalaria glabrata]|nr:phospholipase B-like 2 [Biomphalaria glabrata]KAI8784535.1 phospholipase B 2 [Biomphalaria glabrata]